LPPLQYYCDGWKFLAIQNVSSRARDYETTVMKTNSLGQAMQEWGDRLQIGVKLLQRAARHIGDNPRGNGDRGQQENVAFKRHSKGAVA